MARVLMFGQLADAAGWRERALDAPSVSALTSLLGVDNIGLAHHLASGTIQVVINNILVRDDRALAADDEIAFLPPMSGG